LGEILGASEVSFFSGIVRLVAEVTNFVYQIGLLRVEPLPISLFQISFRDSNILGDAALIICLFVVSELRRDLRRARASAIFCNRGRFGFRRGLLRFWRRLRRRRNDWRGCAGGNWNVRRRCLRGNGRHRGGVRGGGRRRRSFNRCFCRRGSDRSSGLDFLFATPDAEERDSARKQRKEGSSVGITAGHLSFYLLQRAC